MAKGFDCAAKLNSSTASALRAGGYDYVARYLGDSWKSFDAAEAKAIQAAGLKLISIFETNPTSVAYFTKTQGAVDAKTAYDFAKQVGQPAGSAIYFTVDYDAQTSDMGAILVYIDAIKLALTEYKIGLYGSYAVMMAAKGKVDYYWQTYAWSRGNVANFIHMQQVENGVTVAGVQIDRDDVKKDPGAWSVKVKNDLKSPNMYRLVKGTDVYDTSVPTKIFAKLKDGYRVTAIPNDKAISAGMIRLVNAKGDVIDTNDVAKINSLIAAGYLVVFHR